MGKTHQLKQRVKRALKGTNTKLKTLFFFPIFLVFIALITCTVFYTTAPTRAAGNAYYVDFTAGNDINDGSIDHPLKYHPWMSDFSGSVALQPGDTVYLKRGESWTKSNPTAAWLTVQTSGSAENSITTTAYGTGALPVVKIATANDYPVINDAGGHSYITFDSIEVQHNTSTYSAGNKDGIRFAESGANVPHDWNITNCVIHEIPNVAIDGYDNSYNITIGDSSASTTATTTQWSNHIYNFGYAGIMLLGTDPVSLESHFNVYQNYIHDSTQTTIGTNAYGIAFTTRQTTSSRWPKYATARYNYVANIATWEGIDTHGASYLYLQDNYIYNCRNHMQLYSRSAAGYPAAVGDHWYVERNVLEEPPTALYGVNAFIQIVADAGKIITDVDVHDNIIRFTSRSSVSMHNGIRVANANRVMISGNKFFNGPTVASSSAILLEGSGVTCQDITVDSNAILNWGPGVSLTPSGLAGTVVVQRNVIAAGPSSALVLSGGNIGSSALLMVFHNTLYGTGRPFNGAATGIVAGGSMLVMDNIIAYSVSTNDWVFRLAGVLAGTLSVDYNLYLNSTYSKPWYVAAGEMTWAQWQALGYDVHGIGPNINPLFTNSSGSYSADADFYPQLTSPAINAGVDVGLTTDYVGDPVPDEAIPDIGAYEYQHFASTLSQITAVPSVTSNTTPSYTFSSSQVGNIGFTGGCSSGSTTAATGDNTVTFNKLANGTYSDCGITVTNLGGIISALLDVNSFIVDTLAPVLSDGSPINSAYPADTNAVMISLKTNENATCRYSTSPNAAYGDMAHDFDTTGNTSHSSNIINLQNGNYHYYIRCQDTAGNVSSADYEINFSILSPETSLPAPSSEASLPTSARRNSINQEEWLDVQESMLTNQGEQQATDDAVQEKQQTTNDDVSNKPDVNEKNVLNNVKKEEKSINWIFVIAGITAMCLVGAGGFYIFSFRRQPRF